MLGYDSADNTIYIEEIEKAYQDIQIVDFGEVRNFTKSISDDYYNILNSGSQFDGKYEKAIGAYEFNVQTNYSTIFKIPNTINQAIPFHTDSLAFEFTRADQYKLVGLTDTKYDKDIFMVMTLSGASRADQYNPSGFEGIEKYYNMYFIARECIKRNSGILAGVFFKTPTGKIIFTSNSKNIDFEYTINANTFNFTDDISLSELGEPFFYPEEHNFETDLTTLQLNAILANPHGYYKCIDKIGCIHYGYIKNFKTGKLEKTATVTGLTANIDRT
jgi:hypothetical protein